MAASMHCGKAHMRERMCVQCSCPGKCSQPWFHTRATGVNCLNVDIEHERYDATSEREDWAQHFDVNGIVIMESFLVGFEDILGSPLVSHPSSSTWILLSGCWTALLQSWIMSQDTPHVSTKYCLQFAESSCFFMVQGN